MDGGGEGRQAHGDDGNRRPHDMASSSDVNHGDGIPLVQSPQPRRLSKPPPPPIYLRQATATSSSDISSSNKGAEAGKREPEDADTETDHVGELFTPNKRFSVTLERPTTPRRDGLPPSPVGSPSWGSMEPTGNEYTTPTRRGNPRPNSWHRNSLEVPAAWMPPPSPSSSANGALRFEPTPHHGLHARNLSAHFPQPGVPRAPPSPSNEYVPGDSMIPPAEAPVAGAGEPLLESPRQERGKRRGHHHRHSLSHNFFSFLDPTQTAPSPGAPPVNLSPADDKPPSVPMTASASPNALSPLPSRRKDPHVQLLGSFAVIEIVLGIALWIEGQMSGWRSLAGVGYLIVFDAIGLGVNLYARNDKLGWRSLRRPYGTSRVTSLLCFSQSVFLVFAAVYIAKEAVEQMAIGAGGHDHSHGHGHDHSHSHGHGHGDYMYGDQRPFPLGLLGLASAASFFSGAVLDNHRRLVDATGSIMFPPTYLSLPFVKANYVLSNPFTMSVAGTAAVLFLASLVVEDHSLESLDATASLVLTLLTGALAYPPTLAYAHILLQTAPPATSPQMKALRNALREVADDRRVLGLGTLRCWAIDAGKADPFSAPAVSSNPPSRRASRASVSTASPSTEAFTNSPRASGDVSALGAKATSTTQPLVVTLVVHAQPDTTERELTDITRVAWSKISSAIGTEGEVSVQVQRGWS